MADEFAERTGESPPTAPAVNPNEFRERPGASTDRPSPKLVQLLVDYEQTLDDRIEVREAIIPGGFDRDGRPLTVQLKEPLTPDELSARTDRFNAFRENITRLGNRILADASHLLASRAAAITTELAAIDAGLTALIPSTKELGEIGEYSAEEYGDKANELWERRERAVNSLKVLRLDYERHETKRSGDGKHPKAGGYFAGLDLVESQPEMERNLVETLLSSRPVKPIDLPPPQFETVDLSKLDNLRYRTVKMLNSVERVYAELEGRDERRTRLTAKRDERMAERFPAMRGRTRT